MRSKTVSPRKNLRLCVTKRKDSKFEGVDEGPVSNLLDFLSVQGKTVRLERFQVPIDRPNSYFFRLRGLGYGQPVGASLNGPDDAPLSG
jgi:hypothetical protein